MCPALKPLDKKGPIQGESSVYSIRMSLRTVEEPPKLNAIEVGRPLSQLRFAAAELPGVVEFAVEKLAVK
jgi:hypothetical protein